jgi:hypothetical protein
MMLKVNLKQFQMKINQVDFKKCWKIIKSGQSNTLTKIHNFLNGLFQFKDHNFYGLDVLIQEFQPIRF